MKRVLFGMMAFAFGTTLIVLPALSQPPNGKEGKDGKGGGKDGKMAKGGFKLGAALPPMLVGELKLTDDQKAKLQEIETDLKGKLDKLLTDDQKKMCENFRPGGLGGKGGGPGEKGGKGPPPKGEKDGKGGPGEKNGKGDNRPDRPPIEKGGKDGEKSSELLPPARELNSDDAAIQ
jgi:hypothetical protein